MALHKHTISERKAIERKRELKEKTVQQKRATIAAARKSLSEQRDNQRVVNRNLEAWTARKRAEINEIRKRQTTEKRLRGAS